MTGETVSQRDQAIAEVLGLPYPWDWADDRVGERISQSSEEESAALEAIETEYEARWRLRGEELCIEWSCSGGPWNRLGDWLYGSFHSGSPSCP